MHPVEGPGFVFLYVLKGNDQTDCKPETPLLQRNAASSSPPELKTETPQPLVIDNQVMMLSELFYV